MIRKLIVLGAFFAAAVAIQSDVHAQRFRLRRAQEAMDSQPWHGQHYYLPTGQPTALIVPPNVSMQQTYSWGVSQNTMSPIYHHYGPVVSQSSGGAFYATPPWPSSTRQFGVYYVRGPW